MRIEDVSVSIKEFSNALLNERDKRINLHFEQDEKFTTEKISALKELTAQAINASKEAVTKAEVANNLKFEVANNVKAELGKELTILKDDFNKKLLEQKDDFDKKINDLKEYKDLTKGEKKGKKDFSATIISAISLVGVIIAIIISLRGCAGV